MRSLEAKGKEIEELEEVYNNLERDWNAYKQQSKSRTCCADSGVTGEAIQLLHNSPRYLLSQLQGSTAAIAGDERKLKGRRLFEDVDGEDEMRRVVRSLSFCDSEDEANGCKGSTHSSASCSSSSFSPSVSGEEEARVKGAEGSVCVVDDADRKIKINGARCLVMLGGFVIALLIFAICMRSATSYGGFEGTPVPT